MATEPRRVGGTVKRTTNTNTGQVTNYRNGQPIQQHSSGAQIFHQSPNRTSGRLSPEQMAAFNSGNQDINQFLGSQGLLPQNNSVPNYASQIPQAQPQQQQTQAPVQPINMDQFRTEAVTAEDLAKQWGFDYSRDYADRQASVEAEAARNAYNDLVRRNQSANRVNQGQIDSSVAGAAQALDDNYFQQMLQQQQAQVGAGLSGGIAADQDLRLQMNRQNALGDVYRDANVGRMAEQERFTNAELQLMEQLGLVDQQELAYADQLHNQRLNEGFQNALALQGLNQNENLAMLQAALQERGQNIDMSQFADQLGLARDQFGWQRQTDTADRIGTLGGQQTLAANQQNFMQEYMRDDMEYNQNRQDHIDRRDYGALMGMMPNGQQTMDSRMNDLLMAQIIAGMTGTYDGKQTMQAEMNEFLQGIQEAGVTGSYGGSPTMAMQQMLANLTGIHDGNPTLQRRLQEAGLMGTYGGNQTMAMQQMLAGLTGMYDGNPTMEMQQLENRWKSDLFDRGMRTFRETGQMPAYMAEEFDIDFDSLQSADSGFMDLFINNEQRIAAGERPSDILDDLTRQHEGGGISDAEYDAISKSLMTMYPEIDPSNQSQLSNMQEALWAIGQGGAKLKNHPLWDMFKAAPKWLTGGGK